MLIWQSHIFVHISALSINSWVEQAEAFVEPSGLRVVWSPLLAVMLAVSC